MRQDNIFLVGPMGAGKTAVGRHLGKQLGLQFIDSDQEIQDRTGVDIPFIFEKEGEQGFRTREQAVIDEMSGRNGVVLATGGGAVTVAANRQCLAGRGFVVYLFASVEQQAERTRHSRNRPLLLDCDPEEKLQELFEVRDPLYREIADLVVDTNGRRVHDVVEQICVALSRNPEQVPDGDD
ncbi:MAG: shikimate kinase AroK [Gammaproteobacteria bacterium]|nr:shikimate kinase AroK [Gammaproteobacteria bacterium]